MLKYLILNLFILSTLNFSQYNLYSEFTTKEARTKFKNRLLTETINGNLQKSISDSTEKYWMEAFWAAGLIFENSDLIRKSIHHVLTNHINHSDDLLRSTIEAAFTLFPKEFKDELIKFSNANNNPKLFAMALLHLRRQNVERDKLNNLIKIRFPNFSENPILLMLDHKINKENDYSLPPLKDLLKMNSFNKPVVFVFQRKNRNYIGRVILRDADGTFIEESDGKLFSVPILARAVSNFPGFITNGNTPQGVFSIQGTDNSSNIFIGQTENLQTVLPFEVSLNEFLHKDDSNDSVFSLKLYKELLPESWQNYFPIFESFYAGKAGRNEIILHGTTVDTSYYTGKEYAPYTPTQGCLCALELWDENTGYLIKSDQQILIDKFNLLREKKGFMIVIELDNKNSSISHEEIEELIK